MSRTQTIYLRDMVQEVRAIVALSQSSHSLSLSGALSVLSLTLGSQTSLYIATCHNLKIVVLSSHEVKRG